MESCCQTKHIPRSEETVRQLKSCLNRVSGQLAGISRMLDENRYCKDILIQIAAAESALQSIGMRVLQEHMETCVVEQIQAGNAEIVEEAMDLIRKLK